MRGLILGLLLGQAFFLVGHNAAETIIKIDLDAARDDSVPVPQGYVGLSIEPMSQAGIYCKDAVFCQLLKNLVAYDTGTFNIRWGGNMQDVETEETPDEVWEAMADMYAALGKRVSYTIGLNLMKRNVSHAVAQVSRAARVLPPQAVLSLAVGNEPDAYATGQEPTHVRLRSLRAAQRSQAVDKGDAEREEGNQKGESREASGKVADQDPNAEEEEMVTEADGSSSVRLPPRPPGSAYLLGGPGGWLDEQGVWMRALAPAVKSWLGTTRVFQGPAMANMKVWRLGMVEKWAAVAGGGFSSTLSCHKYLASSRDARHATAAHILHESPLGDARNVVERFAGAGKKMGLGFRLDEANSLAASGTRGVSDTMAASLYVADVALSIMQVHADGINFHVAGCVPYSPILLPPWCGNPAQRAQTEDKARLSCPATCGRLDAAAIPNAPYYGLWLLQRALRGSGGGGTDGAGDRGVGEARDDGEKEQGDAGLRDQMGEGRVRLLGRLAVPFNARSKVKVYALTSREQGLRVLLLNKAPTGGVNTVRISITGGGPTQRLAAAGKLTRLTGSPTAGLASTFKDIKLGGQTVDVSTGRVFGEEEVEEVRVEGGGQEGEMSCSVPMPPASAALLEIPWEDA